MTKPMTKKWGAKICKTCVYWNELDPGEYACTVDFIAPGWACSGLARSKATWDFDECDLYEDREEA